MKNATPIAAIVGVVVIVGLLWMVLSKTGHRPANPVAAPLQAVSTSTPGTIDGSIEVLNDNGFTLTLVNGTPENILFTATTTILMTQGSTTSTTTPEELNVGQQVQVQGTPDAYGSINATQILIQ